MANDFSAIYRDVLAPRMIKRLTAKMEGLKYATTDWSEAVYDKNESVSIQVQTKNFVANDFDDVNGIQSQGYKTETKTFKMDKHKEVTFDISDKEMRQAETSITLQNLFDEQVETLAAVQVLDLYNLYKKVYNVAGTGTANKFTTDDIFEGEKILFDQAVNDDPVVALSSRAYTDLSQELKNAGNNAEVTAEGVLRNKNLGNIANSYVFRDQLLKQVEHKAGTASEDTAAFVVDAGAGNPVAGDTQFDVIDPATNGKTFLEGDIITIDGHEQKYVITEDVTTGDAPAVAGGATLKISPALTEGLVANQAITVTPSHPVNLMYAKEFAVHLMRSLDQSAKELGLDGVNSFQQVIVDPRSGTSMRMEAFRDPKLKKHFFTLDVLYSVNLLDERYAVRLLNS